MARKKTTLIDETKPEGSAPATGTEPAVPKHAAPLFIVKSKDGKNHSESLPKAKAQEILDRFVKEAEVNGRVIELFLFEVE